MDKPVSQERRYGFSNHGRFLAGLDDEAVSIVAAAGADIALTLSDDGTVLDIGGREDRHATRSEMEGWVGKTFLDIVTVESREKVEDLLAEASRTRITRARQINHVTAVGRDIPVSYRIVSFPGTGNRIALGQDMRAIADMQQRLVRAQIEMERDFRKIRDVESRYRILFHLAHEPLLVLDAQNMKIIDANEGASRLFDRPVKKLVGSQIAASFAKQDQTSAIEALTAIGLKAREETFKARPVTLESETEIRVTPFREAGRTNLLLCFGPGAPGQMGLAPATRSNLSAVAHDLPDGLVLVDGNGDILEANPAFLDQIRMLNPDRIEGKSLDRWLGGSSVDLQVLLANLREHGSVRRFASILRDEIGGSEQVEIAAARIMTAEGPIYGFSIREGGRSERLPTEVATTGPQIAAQFTDLVGRVPLKDLVRDTADIIEKLCIEAALNLTDNNRASAADMLGLSRQSLYIKLRRYGITDGDAGTTD
jgi:transcriptional regulator PpsR